MAETKLDHERLWQTMHTLLDRVGDALDHGSFLDECLDTIVDLLGADRGLIVLTEPDSPQHVINARSANRALTPIEIQEVSRTLVDTVLETGKSATWSGLSPTDSSASMIQLGILLALAGPLRAAGWTGESEHAVRGVVYVDFRTPEEYIGELQQEFFEAACRLLSMVIDQHRALLAAQQNLQVPSAEPATRSADLSLTAMLRLPGMTHLRDEVESCIQGESSLLILGESGTGKTLLARAIAEAGDRQPTVRATLGASDDLNTITSELFGHLRGSFSGAFNKRRGMVEFAHGGTLILDEILNLPPHAQQLLLDFTQFGTYRPLGYEAPEPKSAQTRIISATNGDIDQAIRDGKFREDLYYRLATGLVRLPPLRERRQDIVPIAESVLRRIDSTREWRLSVQVRRLLLSSALRWPGNIRQLEGVIRRARERAVMRDSDACVIEPEHIEARLLGTAELSVPKPADVSDSSQPLCAGFQVEAAELGDSYERLLREREALDTGENAIIQLALQKYHGVVAHAARELGIPRTSLLSRMATLGIDKPER